MQTADIPCNVHGCVKQYLSLFYCWQYGLCDQLTVADNLNLNFYSVHFGIMEAYYVQVEYKIILFLVIIVVNFKIAILENNKP